MLVRFISSYVEGYVMSINSRYFRSLIYVVCVATSVAFLPSIAKAAITWDAGSSTQWWFDPVNWSSTANDLVPPSTRDATTGAISATDAQINTGTGSLPGGEGVVYDPTNDPNFSSAAARPYPTGSTLTTTSLARDYGPQTLFRFYLTRNTTNADVVTIKSGDLAIESTTIIGRSGSTGTGAGQQNLGEVIQTGGIVRFPLIGVDIGQRETSGWGNGTWDYRGGTLEVGEETGGTVALRLSHGSTTAGVGAGGQGRFIMHNPASGGHVLALNVQSASYAGSTTDPAFDPLDPDGVTTGVANWEFHFENGGTRPLQIISSLSINNGLDPNTGGTRSSRLDLRLDAAPSVTGGIPLNLGLFDVDSDKNGTGVVQGIGSLGGTLSNADGTVNFPDGSTVSAVFGSTKYNWTISYTGNINWSDQVNSVVQSITGAGTGKDVVLIGLGTESVSIPGDYNNNGKVDAADYVLWRKSPGSFGGDPAGYTTWRTNFGLPGAGSGLGTAAVPEPHSVALLIGGVAAMFG